ncbi:hypothetical protein [Streptomyces sp. NPDC059708]|uniref:hypothetical protein n=1 Tax=Streptomyces sp. NPDC059708 TaxID=3346916 RepID=UPI0036CB0FD0
MTSNDTPVPVVPEPAPIRSGRHRRPPADSGPGPAALPRPGELLGATRWWWEGMGGSRQVWESVSEAPMPYRWARFRCRAQVPGAGPGGCGAVSDLVALDRAAGVPAGVWEQVCGHVTEVHPGCGSDEVVVLVPEWSAPGYDGAVGLDSLMGVSAGPVSRVGVISLAGGSGGLAGRGTVAETFG